MNLAKAIFLGALLVGCGKQASTVTALPSQVDTSLTHSLTVSKDPLAFWESPSLANGETNAFVSGLYRDLLGRERGNGEGESWINAIDQRQLSPFEVAVRIAHSVESYDLIIDKMYRSLLGRGAGPQDLYWQRQANDWFAHPLYFTVGDILSSNEFRSLCGSDPQRPDDLGELFACGYQRFLKRNPEPHAVEHWKLVYSNYGRYNPQRALKTWTLLTLAPESHEQIVRQFALHGLSKKFTDQEVAHLSRLIFDNRSKQHYLWDDLLLVRALGALSIAYGQTGIHLRVPPRGTPLVPVTLVFEDRFSQCVSGFGQIEPCRRVKPLLVNGVAEHIVFSQAVLPGLVSTVEIPGTAASLMAAPPVSEGLGGNPPLVEKVVLCKVYGSELFVDSGGTCRFRTRGSSVETQYELVKILGYTFKRSIESSGRYDFDRYTDQFSELRDFDHCGVNFVSPKRSQAVAIKATGLNQWEVKPLFLDTKACEPNWIFDFSVTSGHFSKDDYLVGINHTTTLTPRVLTTW